MLDSHLNFHSANGKRRILIVDDEAVNRELLGVILNEQYETLFAASGMEALDVIHNNKDTLSLVLLDLIMPEVHGMDVLKIMKDNPEFSRIPVIVVTSDKDAEVECLTLGAIDFIPKPFPEPKVIMARVRRTIELSEDRDIIRWTERDPLTGLYNRDISTAMRSSLIIIIKI